MGAFAENEAGIKPSGKRMSDGELKALLDAEKMSALASVWSSKLAGERDDALMYYMNDMSKDMPSMDGRSNAVSSDVADTIEGLLPVLMEIFTGDQVVKFDPVGPEDVLAAEQETEYVNHVFMQDNPGFLVLYSFIKDALLSKVGVVKVWWEENEEIEDETYHDLTNDELDYIIADKDVKIVKHTRHPIEDQAIKQAISESAESREAQQQLQEGQPPNEEYHDVTVRRIKSVGRAKVLGVPPEEFGIEKTARSLRLHECNYCFHRSIVSQNRLIEQGYDYDVVNALPTYTAITMPEEINRDTVAEHQNVGTEHNPAARRIEIIEHYVRMDYEGNGRAELYKVGTGASEGQLLYKNGKLDLEKVDIFPFAAMTPYIMPHRFFGRSVADVVMEIQRIKTALLRAALDNAYLVVNPRVEVSESHASDNTLDDLLTSRPGGVIRTKQPGGINWQEVPSIGQYVFPMMEYQDSRLEKRTGLTESGQGLDPSTLQNQSATAAQNLFTMAQARMKLIARVFAETGIKDLMVLLHGLIRRHGDEARTVRLRNQWVSIDPRDWKRRNDMTVDVGLGTNGKAEQLATIQLIAAYQEKALMGGMTNLVTPHNLYETAKVLTKIAGYKDVDRFFTDPSTQPPPQPPQNPQIQVAMIKAQAQQQLEQMKMQLEDKHETAKFQADAALEQQKFQHERELSYLEMGMKHQEHQQNLQLASQEHQLKQAAMANDMMIAQHQAQVQTEAQQQQAQIANQSAQQEMDLAKQKFQHESNLASQKQSHEISMAGGKPTPSGSPSLLEEIRDNTKPKSAAPRRRRVERDKTGRISHLVDE